MNRNVPMWGSPRLDLTPQVLAYTGSMRLSRLLNFALTISCAPALRKIKSAQILTSHCGS